MVDEVFLTHIAIGRIRRPFALEGVCVASSFGETLTSVKLPYTVLICREDGTGKAEKTIIRRRADTKGVYCTFDGVTSIDDAELLRDFLIMVEATKLKPKRKGEYYHFDLMGLSVVTDAGAPLGTVVEVHNYPTMDALDIARPDNQILVIPLSAECLVSVDTDSKTIVLKASFVEDLL